MLVYGWLSFQSSAGCCSIDGWACDQFPIYDHFRKFDENTVLGLMDNKDMNDPYFFILKRENITE